MTTYNGMMDGAGMRFAIACSRFNDFVVERLESGARDALVRHGVSVDAIDTVWVPGAWELPIAVKTLAETGRYDAIVALGAVIRGSTYHFEVVAGQSGSGLANLSTQTGVVITNGVLTVESIEQAIERAGSKAGNKGAEAALAAIEMVDVLRRIEKG